MEFSHFFLKLQFASYFPLSSQKYQFKLISNCSYFKRTYIFRTKKIVLKTFIYFFYFLVKSLNLWLIQHIRMYTKLYIKKGFPLLNAPNRHKLSRKKIAQIYYNISIIIYFTNFLFTNSLLSIDFTNWISTSLIFFETNFFFVKNITWNYPKLFILI